MVTGEDGEDMVLVINHAVEAFKPNIDIVTIQLLLMVGVLAPD